MKELEFASPAPLHDSHVAFSLVACLHRGVYFCMAFTLVRSAHVHDRVLVRLRTIRAVDPGIYDYGPSIQGFTITARLPTILRLRARLPTIYDYGPLIPTIYDYRPSCPNTAVTFRTFPDTVALRLQIRSHWSEYGRTPHSDSEYGRTGPNTGCTTYSDSEYGPTELVPVKVRNVVVTKKLAPAKQATEHPEERK
jgi:hypothetical protein